MSLCPEEFQYSIPNLEFMAQDFNEKRFKRVTAQSVPLFMRGLDTITVTPSVTGRHEADVEEVLRWAANSGHGDFLIDIGANIGLISCISGNAFSRIYCYEPNPLAFSILKVNTKIALSSAADVRLFNYGIGDENSSVDLVIPKYNWGGAYVVQGNSYDEGTLLKKEGYSSFDPENYLHETVEIRSAADSLGPVFSDLGAAGLKCGVIKIDAEGYELHILRAISRVLPPDFCLVVVFENHLKQQRKQEIVSMFDTQSRLFAIQTKKVRGASIVRLIKSLLGARRTTMLADVGEELGKGNYALLVGA